MEPTAAESSRATAVHDAISMARRATYEYTYLVQYLFLNGRTYLFIGLIKQVRSLDVLVFF